MISKTGFSLLILTCSSLLLVSVGCSNSSSSGAMEILNVSYDPTREFYQEYNPLFSAYWEKKTGTIVTVRQSHGGSGKQARSVIDGLEAHVATLALAYDIDALARKGNLLPEDWQKRLPENSAPYTSTIVFLVRKGNPKNIRNWDDLVRDDIEVITPNPKTSGGARWNYLAAWGYVLQRELGDAANIRTANSEAAAAAEQAAYDFVKRLFNNVPVLDSGARAATTTFAQRGIGDVLITWENEAFLAMDTLSQLDIEMVVPSISILTEPPVAWVDAVTEKRGTQEVAKAYLEYLFSPEGQHLAAKHHFRPRHPEHANPEEMDRFQPIALFSLESVFGSWNEAHEKHFADNALFDQIFLKKE